MSDECRPGEASACPVHTTLPEPARRFREREYAYDRALRDSVLDVLTQARTRPSASLSGLTDTMMTIIDQVVEGSA